MTPADLDRLCLEAMQRIVYFINQSAAQHLRRMRAGWIRRSKTQ